MKAGDEDAADGMRSGYFYGLRVFGPFQRLGLGRALVRRGEGLLRERGFRYATIAVDRENTSARRLYERLGFRAIRERHRSWSYVGPDGGTPRVRVVEIHPGKPL